MSSTAIASLDAPSWVCRRPTGSSSAPSCAGSGTCGPWVTAARPGAGASTRRCFVRRECPSSRPTPAGTAPSPTDPAAGCRLRSSLASRRSASSRSMGGACRSSTRTSTRARLSTGRPAWSSWSPGSTPPAAAGRARGPQRGPRCRRAAPLLAAGLRQALPADAGGTNHDFSGRTDGRRLDHVLVSERSRCSTPRSRTPASRPPGIGPLAGRRHPAPLTAGSRAVRCAWRRRCSAPPRSAQPVRRRAPAPTSRR